MNRIIVLVFLFLTLSCNKPERQTTVQPDVLQFFQVYQTFIQLNAQDSTGMMEKSVLMDSALALHGMDSTQFDTTLSYLEKNPEIFLQAFEMFDDSLRSSLNLGGSD